MHLRKRALMVSLTLAGFGTALFAQTPDAIPPAFEKSTENAENTENTEDTSDMDAFDIDAPKQVQVQVEFVEMSHESTLNSPAKTVNIRLRELFPRRTPKGKLI